MGLDVKVRSERGNRKAFFQLSQVEKITRRSIRQAWFQLGKDLQAEANREILRRPKRGRVYIVRTRTGRRRRHVASAPGETHANLSGTLRRSISWKVHGTEQLDFGYGVSTTLANAAPEYAPFVEFGTRRMKPRPSLENAIDKLQGNAARHFEKAMDRAFREFRP